MHLTLIDLTDLDGFTRTIWLRGENWQPAVRNRIGRFMARHQLHISAISIYPGADFSACLSYANAYGCGSVRKDR
jgi:hypothetical protein